MHVAAQNGHVAVIEALVFRGGNVNTPNKNRLALTSESVRSFSIADVFFFKHCATVQLRCA